LTKRYFICYECGHIIELEGDQLPYQDPQECPACHSTNITLYPIRLSGEDPVPAAGCDPSSGNT
jgi:hypothetical protein